MASPMQVTAYFCFYYKWHEGNETQVDELKNDLDDLESFVEPIIGKIVKKESERKWWQLKLHFSLFSLLYIWSSLHLNILCCDAVLFFLFVCQVNLLWLLTLSIYFIEWYICQSSSSFICYFAFLYLYEFMWITWYDILFNPSSH